MWLIGSERCCFDLDLQYTRMHTQTASHHPTVSTATLTPGCGIEWKCPGRTKPPEREVAGHIIYTPGNDTKVMQKYSRGSVSGMPFPDPISISCSHSASLMTHSPAACQQCTYYMEVNVTQESLLLQSIRVVRMK